MYHFGFILEQTLGHITHGLNLQQFISHSPDVQVEWGLPAWERNGLAGMLPVYRSNWTLQAALQTRGILADFNRSAQMDALFFHTQVTAVLSPDWLRRIPSIVSLDATPRQYDRLGAFYDHSTGPAWLEYWKWRLNRNCFQLARHIVTWSNWARDGLVDEYEVPSSKISVIPPGVDTQAWTHPQRAHSPAGPVRILFVGGNLERKGGKILLEAYRCLRANLVGHQNDRADIPVELHMVTRDAVAPEPGVFIYQSMEPNSKRLKELYWNSDIFCLPTYGDCLPMVLSEAGAAGLPIISTRVAAIPEIVRDGENGLLVTPGNIGMLVETLNLLICNPQVRAVQGEAGRRLICENYDSRKNAAKLLGLMIQVVDMERGRKKK